MPMRNGHAQSFHTLSALWGTHGGLVADYYAWGYPTINTAVATAWHSFV